MYFGNPNQYVVECQPAMTIDEGDVIWNNRWEIVTKVKALTQDEVGIIYFEGGRSIEIECEDQYVLVKVE